MRQKKNPLHTNWDVQRAPDATYVDHDDFGVCSRQVLRLVCASKPTVAGQRRSLTDFP